MALLKFKKGLLQALPTTKAEGTVYITTDSHEMYVDTSASERILLTNFKVFADEATLTAYQTAKKCSEGDLYYVEATKTLKYLKNSTLTNVIDTSTLTSLTTIVNGHTEQIANLTTKANELQTSIEGINASTVETTTPIVVTASVGNYKQGQKISVDDIQTIIKDMLSQDIDASVTTAVNASLVLSGTGAKEVGTVFTPSFSFSTNAGAYSQYRNSDTGEMVNQPTNVSFSGYSVTESNRPDGTTAGTSTSSSGTFTQFTVTDALTSSSPYKLTGSCKSSAGAVPKTYLGVDDPDNQIQAKTWSGLTSDTVYGYRNWFYGYKTAATKLDVAALTSAQMRSLTPRNGSFPSTIATTGMQQMFFAIPAGKKTSVDVSNNVNGAPCTMTKTTVQIQGANSYTAIAYDVWYVNNASADSGNNTYKIVVS